MNLPADRCDPHSRQTTARLDHVGTLLEVFLHPRNLQLLVRVLLLVMPSFWMSPNKTLARVEKSSVFRQSEAG